MVKSLQKLATATLLLGAVSANAQTFETGNATTTIIAGSYQNAWTVTTNDANQSTSTSNGLPTIVDNNWGQFGPVLETLT